MPNKSKQKGDRRERELVQWFLDREIKAERARGSDGRALGEEQECDLRLSIGGELVSVQVKGRKAVADCIKPPEGVAVTIMREDGGSVAKKSWVVMRLEDWVLLHGG